MGDNKILVGSIVEGYSYINAEDAKPSDIYDHCMALYTAERNADSTFDNNDYVWEMSHDIWSKLKLIGRIHFVPHTLCGIEIERGSEYKDDSYVRLRKKRKDPTVVRPYSTSAFRYEIDATIKKLNNLSNKENDMKRKLPEIETVIFNNPATIIKWKDGTKTVVKCGEAETYDPEKGLAMAISKKTLGNEGNYYKTFKKWLPKESESKKFAEIGKAVAEGFKDGVEDNQPKRYCTLCKNVKKDLFKTIDICKECYADPKRPNYDEYEDLKDVCRECAFLSHPVTNIVCENCINSVVRLKMQFDDIKVDDNDD